MKISNSVRCNLTRSKFLDFHTFSTFARAYSLKFFKLFTKTWKLSRILLEFCKKSCIHKESCFHVLVNKSSRRVLTWQLFRKSIFIPSCLWSKGWGVHLKRKWKCSSFAFTYLEKLSSFIWLKLSDTRYPENA